MVSLEFLININLSRRTMAQRSIQPLTEMGTRNISLGLRRPVLRADNLTTFMCRLSWSTAASVSWNPQGSCRPVQGLLYLHFYLTKFIKRTNRSTL